MKFTTACLLVAAAASVDPSSAFVSPVNRQHMPHFSTSSAPEFRHRSASSSSTTSNTALSVSMDAVTSSPLFNYAAEKLIDVSIPTVAALIVTFFFFSQFKGAKGDKEAEAEENSNAIAEIYNDLYGSTKNGGIMGGRSRGPFGGGGFGGGRNQEPQLPKNLGLPAKEYIKITNMNEKFDAYDFSVIKSTESKAKAAAKFRGKSFERALGIALNSENPDGGNNPAFPAKIRGKLVEAEKTFLKQGKDLLSELQNAEAKLAEITMDAELSKLLSEEDKKKKEENKAVDAEIVDKTANSTVLSTKAVLPKSPELVKKITQLQTEIKELELAFMAQVIAAIGAKRGLGIRQAVLGDITVRGAGGLLMQIQERPLSAMLGETNEDTGARPKSLFVMNFPGDVQASQLNELREEVTAIVRNAQPGDEALVVLQSGGGTVTGYGLATGMLVRLKEKGLKLTIAVEQVAASGGYMMSCVADKIVASPFAVLGSIGVISEIPNFYERLKEEGIEFQTVTAGKFKRTLTPTKKVTKEDAKKSQQDIEQIFKLFKGWVGQNRPQLNIDEVATGETWFGSDAMERGLCDEIMTADDVILKYIDEGFNVYEVKYEPPMEVPSALSTLFASEGAGPRTGGSDDSSLGRQAIRWAVRSVAEEVNSVMSDSTNGPSVDKRYMAQDDTQDHVKISDDLFY
ncbi:MAG: hypothetical protein SGILL_007652 [Bacillariaceae sp.]